MPGRIATAQMFHNSQSHVASAREREVISSEKASTGKEIVRPSQDPSGYMIASSLKDDLSTRETIAKNASYARNLLSTTENIFIQLQDKVQRAYELSVASSGNTVDADATRKFMMVEVETIYESVLQSLNMRFGNRTLLAGHRSDGPAFNPKGQFIGDNGQIDLEIAPNMKVPINVSAQRLILGQGMQGGVDIVKSFQNFIEGLRLNDTEMVQTSMDNFVKANNQISLARGEIGARMLQIDHSLSAFGDVKVDAIDTISRIEEADAAKVFSELARDQTVLKAAISTTDKLLSNDPSAIFFK